MPPPIRFVEVPWAGKHVRLEFQRVTAARARPLAPLLVFLHEGLGSLGMWRDFPQQLCDAVGVHGLVYSRPGYGRSTPRGSDEHWGVDFMHRQAHEVLPALLDTLRIDRTHNPPWLLGHSDGASIALLYAAKFPRAVGGVVVMAPHLSVEAKAIASIQLARDNYLNTDLKERLARYHDDVDSAFWGWNDIWLQPPFAQWNIEAEVAGVAAPLLAMQGVDDEYGTLDQIHAVARRVPHAELLELPACGHSPHRDQSARVIEAATRFINARLDSPSQRPTNQPAA